MIGHQPVVQDLNPAESGPAAHHGEKDFGLWTAAGRSPENKEAMDESGNAVVKPLPIGFDTRKTHSDELIYTTHNKSVLKIRAFQIF
jgi:hypothetical protein